MLELEEALAQILATVPAPSKTRVAVADADGRVAAEPVRSPIDLPIFDNSAMDGYAVRAADVRRVSEASPVSLQLIGRAAAGDPFSGEVSSGTCVRLFTGSRLPDGADAVVMQEDTRVDAADPKTVVILSPAKPWENTRLQGEDVKRGSRLVESGTMLSVGHISLLAACGCAEIDVGSQPIAGLMATGSELKEPGQTLSAGQIFESNRVGLAALARRAGATPRVLPLVPDTLDGTHRALTDAFEQCDLVITSGGVSVGEMDFVKRAFEQLGGELQFWKVAIKPGRPFVFGRYREKCLFGLPGNPISALVTFLLLVRPALLRWQGATQTSLPSHPGVLSAPIANPGSRRHFVRVRMDRAGQVHSSGLQASHALSSLATANGLLDVPPDTTLLAGASVQVLQWL
jgi:molybdopterin molybdotransferase